MARNPLCVAAASRDSSEVAEPPASNVGPRVAKLLEAFAFPSSCRTGRRRPQSRRREGSKAQCKRPGRAVGLFDNSVVDLSVRRIWNRQQARRRRLNHATISSHVSASIQRAVMAPLLSLGPGLSNWVRAADGLNRAIYRYEVTRELLIQAVLMALWQREERSPVILHSDRGCQFTRGE